MPIAMSENALLEHCTGMLIAHISRVKSFPKQPLLPGFTECPSVGRDTFNRIFVVN